MSGHTGKSGFTVMNPLSVNMVKNQQVRKGPCAGLHYIGSHVVPDDHVLSRLYANQQSLQVRLVSHTKRPRIPTVRELIDQLSKKHERLLREELEQEKSATPSDR